MEQEQVKQLIKDVLAEQRAERIRHMESQAKMEIDKKVERLCLISFSQHIFLPDAKGRAIGTMAVYARVKLREDDTGFYGGTVMIVAHGDGRIFKEPMKCVISAGVTSIIEVTESILEGMTAE